MKRTYILFLHFCHTCSNPGMHATWTSNEVNKEISECNWTQDASISYAVKGIGPYKVLKD